jgi:Tubulin like
MGELIVVDSQEMLRIKKRLEALKRGAVHRVKDSEPMPSAVHVVGIGKAGTEFITQMIKQAPDDWLADSRQRFTALAVDIGDQHFQPLQDEVASWDSQQVQVRTCSLPVPSRDELFSSLRRYREYLKLEYPRYYWNPNYEPWLPNTIDIPQAGEHFPRAIAKAIYGKAYYEGDRVLDQELELFTNSVDATTCQSIVCIVFGLGGGTSSGIVMDLARHLSNVKFGRRALVLGIGIAPCAGDPEYHQDGSLFPTLNELDCMLDQDKNQGVVQVWGDLYRNPFTAGFLLVPQKSTWEETGDLTATQQQIDRELASFLTRDQGLEIYETLRLLNWVGAPPTQHMAARSQYGARWAHIFGFTTLESNNDNLPDRLGIKASTFHPDFFEIRASTPPTAELRAKLTDLASKMNYSFAPILEPEIAKSFREGSLSSASSAPYLQFVIPGATKTALDIFYEARLAYDQQTWDEKLLQHSWLLELGVMLSEPAIRFEGMAGECLWGCACWVVVPYNAIRGEDLEEIRQQLEATVNV